MYDTSESATIYRNFLNWLFATFGEDEAAFRQTMIARLRLKPGNRLPITRCGLGDDVLAVLDAFGDTCRVRACDLSVAMVAGTEQALRSRPPTQLLEVAVAEKLTEHGG
jgi:ubiquinone/menaquinone biosynthesis C-methylase UbiE